MNHFRLVSGIAIAGLLSLVQGALIQVAMAQQPGVKPIKALLVRDTQGGVGTARRTIAVSDLKIQSWNWSGGDFTLSFPTATNRSYVVERANTLSPAGWATLTTFPGNGSVRSVTHTNATAAQQFYRLRTE